MALADRYDLIEPLGQGSFGQVVRGFDRLFARPVAIKILHRHDDDARRRFHREAVILHSQIRNDFVVGLLDHQGLNDDRPYLVLELCELNSLASWVSMRRGWLDIATALLHAARGLAGVHAAGGLHRDIKPENLLLARAPGSPGWRVKIADFGLAGLPHPLTGNMTRSAAGTDGYIAPEVLAGVPFQAAADVYSLGIVGVALLVGRLDVAALHACAAPVALTALVRSMVNGLPQSRPTAHGVISSLETLLGQVRIAEAPVAMERTPSQVTAQKGFAAVGLAAIFLGVAWLSGNVGTYYDPEIDRHRGPDGRFRKG